MDDEEISSNLGTYEKNTLKKISGIIEICEKIPETYREKCFEILLNNTLHDTSQQIARNLDGGNTETEIAIKKPELSVPIDVRAFLTQYEINELSLNKLFIFGKGNEIRTTYHIDPKIKSTAQIQIALLTALENSIKDSDVNFEFSSEEIRKRCQNNDVYDNKNFKRHFKANSNFFKSLSDLEHIGLSPDGKSELADVITKVIHE